MTHQPNPNDPYRSNLSDEPVQRPPVGSEFGANPELAQDPASGGKVAMFALAIAVVLGAAFYGLNNTSVNSPGTGQTATTQSPPANQSTAQTSPPQAPPGMRDVTPRRNTDADTTVGAAPARPMGPPSNGPTGTEVDRAGSPTSDRTTR